ncbi:MAG: hypothetical protein WA803_05400 [Steroidobacteraceae bacterium]
MAAIVVFIVVYAGLSHYANSAAQTRDLAVALALAPVLGFGLLLIRRSRALTAVLAATAAALALRRFWPLLTANFSWVYLIQEGGFYGLMALSFGRSLNGNRVAVCTRLADRVHGPLSPAEVRYTRRVTAAWAVFFASIAAATVGLFYAAPLRIWSLFANFCVPPLICLMFVGEYAVRRRALPNVQRRGILAAVRVYFARSTQEPV